MHFNKKITFGVQIYPFVCLRAALLPGAIAFRHSSILIHPRKLYMVEVVGTAPTSAMFITKFVYRHSWKSNINNIKLYFKNSIYL